MIIDDLFDSYDDYDDDDYDDDYAVSTLEARDVVTIRVQNIADGATNIQELVDMLRIYADFLDTLTEEGFELADPITNGNGHAYLPKSE